MNATTGTKDQTNELTINTVKMEQNPMAVFLSRQSPSSRYTYELDLRLISGVLGIPDPFACPWHLLRFQHTQAIRTALTETVNERTGKPLSPATINRRLCALRGVLKMAWRLGLMSAEDYYRAIDIECVKGEMLPAGRELGNDEIERLMEVCSADPTEAGARDGAIIALMYTCGLRRHEVTDLTIDDYNTSNGRLVISGKRNKQRTAYLVNNAKQVMDDWLVIRGEWAGPCFYPFIEVGSD